MTLSIWRTLPHSISAFRDGWMVWGGEEDDAVACWKGLRRTEEGLSLSVPGPLLMKFFSFFFFFFFKASLSNLVLGSPSANPAANPAAVALAAPAVGTAKTGKGSRFDSFSYFIIQSLSPPFLLHHSSLVVLLLLLLLLLLFQLCLFYFLESSTF